MPTPTNIKEWLQGLPIPWLAGRTYGSADVGSYGEVLDDNVDDIKESVKARFPDYAPSDALPYIGNDRGLIQGPSETNADFILRLKTAWNDWARAGTPLELLVQLYWANFPGATIIQQNGLAYSLSGNPVAGEDPGSLLVISNVDPLPADLQSDSDLTRVIPSGTPWWLMDESIYATFAESYLQDQTLKVEFTSRFVIVFTSLVGFTHTARATFTSSSSASVTWSVPFDDTTYKIIPGVPVRTSGTAGKLVITTASKTVLGATVSSSSSFTGYADILAWAGSNPFNDLTLARSQLLRLIIQRWKPAKASCIGIYIMVKNPVWGFPLSTGWGDSSLTWGAGNASNLITTVEEII
jgi:hypothetical protein